MAKINSYPVASTPLTGAETAIGTGADGVTTQQLQVSAIAALGTNQQSVANLAALRALTSLSGGPGAVIVRSYATPGDGGGGVFVYDANDTTTADNGGTIIAPTSILTGRWYRLYSGPLDIRWFGGIADGATDTTTALDAAISSFTSTAVFISHLGGPRVYFPGALLSYHFAATYNLKKTVILEGDSAVYATGGLATILTFPSNTAGFIVNSYNTYGYNTVPPTSGADATLFRNLAIIGGGGTDVTQHGVWFRAAGTMEDCIIENFPGNNYQIVAQIGAGGANEGQASGCRLSRCVSVGSGLHALFIAGDDANVTLTEKFHVHTAGAAGICDQSFLGSYHISAEVDQCNLNQVCQVSYTDGNVYQYINVSFSPTSNVPGSNNRIWYLVGATAAFPGRPAWSNTGSYTIGSPYFCGNTTPVVFTGCYVEGSLPLCHTGANGMLLGCSLGSPATSYTSVVGPIANFGGFMTQGNGIGDFSRFTSGGTSYVATALLGANNPAAGVTGGFSYNDSQYFPGTVLFKRSSGGLGPDWTLNYGDVTNWFVCTGPSTANQFGTGAAQPMVFSAPKFALGSTIANARIHDSGTAAPTTGAHGQGEIVWNINCAAAGQVSYWQCTAAGAPGTWVAHNL